MPVTFTRLARDLVDISGSDQRSFLQGLISQDVEKVTVDRSVYGTLLTPQGKYLHDFIIAARDSILVASFKIFFTTCSLLFISANSISEAARSSVDEIMLRFGIDVCFIAFSSNF